MKTTGLKLLTILLLLTLAKPWAAQVLVLKGYIKTAEAQNTNGYYELRNACNLLAMGHGSGVKLKLQPNQVYTLKFSKPGFQSKTIVISTFANNNYWYRFSFHVVLNRITPENMTEPLVTAGSIFYDEKTGDYNYQLYLKDAFAPKDRQRKAPDRAIYTALKSGEYASVRTSDDTFWFH